MPVNNDIYNIDFSKKAVEFLPPDKRMPSMVSMIRQWFKQLQWNRLKVFQDYKQGASGYPTYTAGTYNQYDRVIYGQSVYESLINSNTDLPTVATSWTVYQANFIGVDERILYNHQKLVLEYALNERFGTAFRQPPSTSDIYITNNTPAVAPFIVGINELESSDVFLQTSSDFIIDSYSFGTFNNFTINVPSATYTALGSAAESIIRGFVDLYNTIGLFYNINVY
jgi:hypothetical protein